MLQIDLLSFGSFGSCTAECPAAKLLEKRGK